jgi:hypothetical protein
MVRVFAACALVFSSAVASAQTVTPTIVPSTASDPEPTLSLAVAPRISACNGPDCPSPAGASDPQQPVDNHALLKQKLAELNCLQSEIETLRIATGTPEQISVKVRMLEVSKTKMKQLGIDDSLLKGKPRSAQPAPYSAADESKAVGFVQVKDANQLNAFIDQLLQNNVAKVITEPRMLVTCGRPAQFNVGGEIPIPSAPGQKPASEYKPIGTQVDVLATAMGDNRIRLDLRARFSVIDHGRTMKVNGAQLPGLSTKQVACPLTLELGKAGLVLSGLVERRVETVKYPNGNTAENVNHIELVVLVTAEAADPLDVHAEGGAGHEYHTAVAQPEVDPKERSRVVRDTR